MLGRAQVMTPEGVRELPVYVDNKDLAADFHAGVIKPDEEIVYKDSICEVIGDFVDEDGERYTQLIGKQFGVGFFQQGGPTQHVEFRMG